MVEIRVPTLGESVTEATIGRWFKQPGEAVAVDEPVVELETDKVTIEVPAPAAGVLSDIAAKDGSTVAVGALLGRIEEGAGAAASPTAKPSEKTTTARPVGAGPEQPRPRAPEVPPPPQAAQAARVAPADVPLAPSVRKLAAESGIDAAAVPGSGRDGRVTKGDMLAAI